MGRHQKRQWSPSPLSAAVEAVGGTRWAAAICNISEERIRQSLMQGYLHSGAAALALCNAARRHGHNVDLAALVVAPSNGDAPPPVEADSNRGSAKARGSRAFATHARPHREVAEYREPRAVGTVLARKYRGGPILPCTVSKANFLPTSPAIHLTSPSPAAWAA